MPDNSNRTSNHGPRVSHVTTKAFTAGPGHYLMPSWLTLEVDGPTLLDGRVAAAGNVALTGTFALGASGTSYSALRSSTISVSPGAVAAHDSISTTATIQLMPADATVLAAQPASIWSGAYFDIQYMAQVSAASTLRLSFANSTLTSVTPDNMNWTVVYVDPS